MRSLHIETPTDPQTGLRDDQIPLYPKNKVEDDVSKSYRSIFLQHTFTFFNVVNFVLAGLVIYTGSYRNMLFMIIVILNMIIGMFQEIRARRVLDKLALLHQQQVSLLRNEKIVQLPVDEIVQNDILLLQAGNQVPVDGVVISGACEVNESMLTGESDAIVKQEGDPIYGGCYVVAGACHMQAVAVGDQTYTHSILKEVRRSKRYPSQLRDALQQIVKICTYLLIPMGILLFAKTYWGSDLSLNASILATVASMVGMIPEGLIILTSIALTVASVKLAKKEVLVQELYCIETLARVDVLCLDKTGTLTQGKMRVASLIAYNDWNFSRLQQLLSCMYNSLEDDNATARAIRSFCEDEKPEWISDHNFPFSSSNKFAGVIHGNSTWLAGAYNFMEESPDPKVEEAIEEYAAKGIRVLAVMEAPVLDKLQKGHYKLAGLVLIEDLLRPNVEKTLQFFEHQGVQIKIISGDMAQTTQAIAARVSVHGKAVNMNQVSDANLAKITEQNTIFGRVTPDQKREMVKALKQAGHTVAMTGDGVNDVMALKEADCSIAMGSGSQAARSIASLVLLEDQFNAMPSILNEGRRVINNIERTSSLFLVKTLFSVGLSLVTLFILARYPFQPIQLTLISSLGVGIPAFILTLEPNYLRVSGNFLINVLSRAIPGALSVVTLVLAARILSIFFPLTSGQFSTVCTWLAGINALWVLHSVCIPLTHLRKLLLVVMSAFFAFAMVFLRPAFFIELLPLIWYGFIIGAGFFIPVYLHWLKTLGWKRLLARTILQNASRRRRKKEPVQSDPQ